MSIPYIHVYRAGRVEIMNKDEEQQVFENVDIIMDVCAENCFDLDDPDRPDLLEVLRSKIMEKLEARHILLQTNIYLADCFDTMEKAEAAVTEPTLTDEWKLDYYSKFPRTSLSDSLLITH